MSRKNKKASTLVFEDGMNAGFVTGSMIYLKTEHHNILLEAGLFQGSNDIYEDYKINSRTFKSFKPKDIDIIILGHVHADHSLLIPRLYSEGCHATIYAPKGTTELFTIMAQDSCYIIQKDVDWLRKKYNRDYKYLYHEDDIHIAANHIVELDYHQHYDVDENFALEFVPSGHIICAAQTKMWIKENNNVKTLLYTSDLGNYELPKHYATPFEPVEKCHVAIVESTYADGQRHSITQKDRDTDLAKIKTVITQTINNNGRVMIPVFSLDRCQNMLTILYDLFGENKSFSTPILVDSPLAIKICKEYTKLLEGEELEKWEKVMSWKNVKFIHEYTDSRLWQDTGKQCVVLTASGFLVRGRSREWTKTILPEANSHIMFCGYASESSLAGKIKRATRNKTLTIDSKPYRMKCNITDLKSFSSHIQHEQMLDYYSSIRCDKIALVHGDFKSKCEFAKKLENKISERNRTSKVVVVNPSTKINL